MKLKRLWDTTKKQVVWSNGVDGKPCQLWTDEEGDKVYIYSKGKWYASNVSDLPDGFTYKGQWIPVAENDEVGYYDTNKATDLFAWEEGKEASYSFVDYDGTVLDSGTVDEGETPTAPADPSREATAQYTYTFSGWKPTVGPIYKKTTFKAQYTETLNTYTVTIAVNDDTYGYTEPATITSVPYGVAVSEDEDHVLSIGTTTVTPHANEGYHFASWSTLPETITGATTITATFEANA